MMGIAKWVIRKMPAQWWRGSIKNILNSIFSFYLLGIATNISIIEKYRTLLIESLFWYFIVFQLLSFFLFYIFLDYLLRLLAYKIIKPRVENFAAKIRAKPYPFLRVTTESRDFIISFLMGQPVKLGYVNSSDIKEISNEIKKADEIKLKDEHKEKVVNELISAINKWACVLIHLLITLFLVYHYNKILMAIIFVVGFIITLTIYFAVILAVKNIEAINIILKSFEKKQFN